MPRLREHRRSDEGDRFALANRMPQRPKEENERIHPSIPGKVPVGQLQFGPFIGTIRVTARALPTAGLQTTEAISLTIFRVTTPYSAYP